MQNHYLNTNLKNIKGEVWVDAVGLDGYCEVSNFGRIKSLGRYVNVRGGQRWKKELIRKQTKNKGGFLVIGFTINNQKLDFSVSRLVYFSFNLKQEIKGRDWVVMHKNKIKTDNRLSNLEYVTCSKSHSVNFKKGIAGHHLVNGQKAHRKFTKENSVFDENGKTILRTCKDCNKLLPQNNFQSYGTNTCNKCRYQKWKKRQELLKVKNPKEFEKKRLARNEQLYAARRKRKNKN